MDLKRAKELAGIQSVITEERHTDECEFAPPMMGQFGNILRISGKSAGFLAKSLDISPHWKLTPVGHVYAAYDGESISFFSNKMDFTDEG